MSNRLLGLQKRIEEIRLKYVKLSDLTAKLPLIEHGKVWYVDYKQQALPLNPIDLKGKPVGNLLVVLTNLQTELESLQAGNQTLLKVNRRLELLEASLLNLKNKQN
jgi:hypothetical protein